MQWAEHITMAEVRWRWEEGDEKAAAVKVTKHRLEWLGHLVRMAVHRIPKSALLGGCLGYVQDVAPPQKKVEGCD